MVYLYKLFQRNRKILRYYPTFILLTSIVTFLFWMVYDRESGVGEALILSVSPIMINMPLLMSLALSLPFSNFFLYSGLKKKFFYKNSSALESLDKTDTLIFDKTVLIVDRIPMVTDIFTFNDFDGNTVLKIAASVENQLDNNIARAIVKEAKNRNFDLYTPSSFNHILGAGIEAKVLTYQVFIGSKELMKMKNINTLHMERIANKVASDLKTPIFIAIDNKPAGIIATLNVMKKDAINISEEMKKINITPVLITGDSLKAGISYGESLGIEQKNIFTDCIPTKKLKVIEDLKKKSHRIAILKNDSESDYHQLQDDIVISIDKKNIDDLASDISIQNSDLSTLKEPFIHAANVMKKVRQNLFWTYIYLTT
ncbi:HAD family hydrolase, partial [bacterium]